MRKQFVTGIVAACLMLVLTTGVCHAQSKIAVANPAKILNELAETKDFNKGVEAEVATFKQQLGERDNKLKDLQAQEESRKTGTPQWDDLNKQRGGQKTERETWAQNSQADIFRKLREQAKQMHDKITAAVADVAKAKGFDLVVAEQKAEVPDQQLEQMNPQQVTQLLFSANILFKTDAIDVTQEVIAKLDAGYKAK